MGAGRPEAATPRGVVTSLCLPCFSRISFLCWFSCSAGCFCHPLPSGHSGALGLQGGSGRWGEAATRALESDLPCGGIRPTPWPHLAGERAHSPPQPQEAMMTVRVAAPAAPLGSITYACSVPAASRASSCCQAVFATVPLPGAGIRRGGVTCPKSHRQKQQS